MTRGRERRRALSKGKTIGIRRLVVLAAVAAASFALAAVSFADPVDRDCSATTREDGRYRLGLEGPYEGGDDHATYRLVVERDGRTVDPARVCLSSVPGGVVVVVDDDRRAHLHVERARAAGAGQATTRRRNPRVPSTVVTTALTTSTP